MNFVKELIFLGVFTQFIALSAGSALHGECLRNEHCGTFDTYCKNGTCVCKENFAVIFDTCVHLATPRIPCARKQECQSVLGIRSLCKDGQCVCKSFHHIYNDQCVKSRGLDELCDFDHQCYCGKNCEDKIECSNRMCRCKPEFRQHNRRCISNSVNLPTFSFKLLGAMAIFLKML